jgi:hypothetical protein
LLVIDIDNAPAAIRNAQLFISCMFTPVSDLHVEALSGLSSVKGKYTKIKLTDCFANDRLAAVNTADNPSRSYDT